MSSATADHPPADVDRPGPGRRLRAALVRGARAALIPVGACVLTLTLLTAYAATGAAGEPVPKIQVSTGWILQPAGQPAAAFFEIRNTGDIDDTLLYADSPALGVSMLRKPDRKQPGTAQRARRVAVPARSTVRMAEGGIHIAVLDPPALRPLARVPFNLWFEGRGRVKAMAVLMPPDGS
ncbi:copper chaperone PCu(A)C [Streptomyces sp. NPDC021098]|uniref:copper chaperone PCu(A)C n=1 Tax=unclassified Streptomyces TaxID=2593676 RepID=UPI00379E853A